MIFLFLRNVSATIIPSLALPLSIVGTFAVMYLLGYRLDNLSLMALTLSVGFVVDDAIVMLENIVRHMEMGERPLEAALKGSKEIGFTILSMTISLAAVFIPILFMGGILGRLFHEFAVTIGVAILVSGFVSLSLTPMLQREFLRPHEGRAPRAPLQRHGARLRVAARHLRGGAALGARATARTTLVFSLHHPRRDGVALHDRAEGLHPQRGPGQIFINIEAAQGIVFDDAGQAPAPGCRDRGEGAGRGHLLLLSAGSRGANEHRASSPSALMPKGERDSRSTRSIAELRPKLNAIPGIRAFVQNPPPIRLGGRTGNAHVPVHAAGGRYRRALSRVDDDARARCASCRASSTSPPTCR